MEAPTRFKCIVCIGLLNNPVILPCCGNYLCKACIHGLTQSGTSRCPYPQCSRERLQNKIRTAEKKGKLYATELWDEIQQRFPNFDYEGNDDVEFVDKDDKDVVRKVIRTEVNGEIRREWEANEARLKAERDRKAKEEEKKLMKMTEDPENKEVAEDIKRNKEMAEQERLSLEYIKKLTEGSGSSNNNNNNNNVNNKAPTGIDMEQQKKIMEEIERRKNQKIVNSSGSSSNNNNNNNSSN